MLGQGVCWVFDLPEPRGSSLVGLRLLVRWEQLLLRCLCGHPDFLKELELTLFGKMVLIVSVALLGAILFASSNVSK